MVTVESSRALVAGELDVIICRGAPRGRGVQQLVSVAVSRDYLIGVVTASHPFAGQQRISLDQLRRQPLVIAPPEDEPAVIKTLRDVLPDLGAWPGVTHAADAQTIMGLAACGFGVGLGPQDMRTAARPDTWICRYSSAGRPAQPDVGIPIRPPLSESDRSARCRRPNLPRCTLCADARSSSSSRARSAPVGPDRLDRHSFTDCLQAVRPGTRCR